MRKQRLNRPTLGRIPYLTVIGGIGAILVFLFGEPAFELLVWEKGSLGSGELWRLLSGHFVHTSVSHLLYDVAAFLLLGSFVESKSRVLFLQIVFGTAFLTALLLVWSGRFSVYCGLSGVDVGLFLGAAILLIRRGRSERDWLSTVLGLGAILLLVVKLGFELSSANSVFLDGELGGFSVAVEAHIAGVLATIPCFFLTTYQLVGFKLRPCHKRDNLKRLDSAS